MHHTQRMKPPLTQPALLGAFSCLGAQCPDTCCHAWDMPVDAQRQALYLRTAPELLESINSQRCMKRDASGACVQFENGWCGIQKRYGAEYLSDACHSYPRLCYQLGDITVMQASLSCPETLRLLFTMNNPLAAEAVAPARLPPIKTIDLPEGVTAESARATMQQFTSLVTAHATPEAIMQRVIACAFAIDGAKPTPKSSDPFKLLYALALLPAFSEGYQHAGLERVLATMQQVLDCSLNREARSIVPGVRALANYAALSSQWQQHCDEAMQMRLRRWIEATLAATAFPWNVFPGLHLHESVAILAVRFATIRLALMCHMHEGCLPDEATTIRVMGAIARLMDHLADPALSLMIYRDAGWLNAARLHGLVSLQLMPGSVGQ